MRRCSIFVTLLKNEYIEVEFNKARCFGSFRCLSNPYSCTITSLIFRTQGIRALLSVRKFLRVQVPVRIVPCATFLVRSLPCAYFRAQLSSCASFRIPFSSVMMVDGRPIRGESSELRSGSLNSGTHLVMTRLDEASSLPTLSSSSMISVAFRPFLVKNLMTG